MTREARLTMSWAVAAVLGVALVGAGAAAAYLMVRPAQREAATDQGMQHTANMPAPPPAAGVAPAVATDAPLQDVVVPLTQESIERAGIDVAPVAAGTAGATVRVPGVVEPNAYRQVVVTPLVAGRITRVAVELGSDVRRAQSMAQIYSPELAEAQTQYLSARAVLQATEQQVQRTDRLVQIGAASRQELELLHAQHTGHETEVAGARSRLVLLGMSAAAIDRLASAGAITATTDVAAPVTGVVTERNANVGLNVDQSTKLFTVTDLSAVWVIGELYEKDFPRVRVGSPATVTTTAYPDLRLTGRVSYIDPQVNPYTRTARVRVEVANPQRELRLGMYAEIQTGEPAAASTTVIPRSAIQNVGDRQVVYLVNPKEKGRFVEREVHLGKTSGEEVEVVSGVTPGDVVVVKGSFFVRAERERLGLRAPAAAPPTAVPSPAATGSALQKRGAVQTARVMVGEQGFEPARLTLKAGSLAQITFVRTTDKTCATEISFPSLGMKRPLPLNQPVVVELTPSKGEVAFVCGMGMFRGAVVVQ